MTFQSNITKKGILGLLIIGGLFLLSLLTMNFDPDVTEWTVVRSVNYTHWNVERDSIVDADTTAFFLSNAGSGQILLINPDADDTLGISFDNGGNWLLIPPDFSSATFSPANEDSIHFLVFGATAGDTTISPDVAWTTLSEDR